MRPAEVHALAVAHGLTHEQAVVATAIAWAESGLREDAVGDEGLQDAIWGPSIGLWQIRSLRAHTGTAKERDANRLTDPDFNAGAMAVISRGGTDWMPWSAWKNGRYLTHIDDVQDVVAPAGGHAMKIFSRAEWGASNAAGITRAPGMTRGIGLHHLGAGRGPTGGVEESMAKMRRVQDFHMGPDRGWADYAYNCLPAEAEILTADGWKSHHEVKVGDEVLTLNHETGLSEWQPTTAVHRHPGSHVLHVSAGGIPSTAGHRWPVLRRVRRGQAYEWARAMTTTEALRSTDRVPVAALCADVPADPKYRDDFVELVAWFWTEGHILKSRGNQIRTLAIYQSQTYNPGNVARIKGVLTRLFGPESSGLRRASEPTCGRGHDRTPENTYTRPSGRSSCRICWLAQSRASTAGELEALSASEPRWASRADGSSKVTFFLNATIGAEVLAAAEAPDKVVRYDFIRALTQAQLDLFIRVSILADGHRNCLAQKDKARTEALGFAIALSGQAPSFYTVPPTSSTAYSMHGVLVKVHRNMGLRRKEPQARLSYEGVVWCPTTANGTWYARYRGRCFFTGNSAVDHLGNIFEGRGPFVRNAANGGGVYAGYDANAGWFAILYLAGSSGPDLTPAAQDAINDYAASLGLAGGDWLGHDDFLSTACPGADRRRWLDAGHPRGSGAPTPQPEQHLEVSDMWVFDYVPDNSPDGRPVAVVYTDGRLKWGLASEEQLAFFASGQVHHLGSKGDQFFHELDWHPGGTDSNPGVGLAEVDAGHYSLAGGLDEVMARSSFETGDPGCAGPQ